MNTLEEQRSAFLTAEWRWLAMLNYEVDPAALSDLVPPGTTLDLWQGRALVSMVGFRFLDTRVLGLPIPFHRNFDEVNLRFYVRREAADGTRRGAVFVKEIVPRTAIAWTARLFYGENYSATAMRHDLDLPSLAESTAGSVAYEWRNGGRWNRLAARIDGRAELPELDSEEAFITEHYWGYSARSGDTTVEYRVEHPRWRVWRVAASELDCDAESLYGPAFAGPLSREPSSAFVAVGSEVLVRKGRKLPRSMPD